MKKTLLSLVALGIAATGLRAQTDISLNGPWTFRTPDTPEQTVTVPHTYNIMDGLEEYAGTACYERELPDLAGLAGRKIRLHFKAVYHDAVVYVNGIKAGEHMDAGYTPFSFDITPLLDFRPGAANTLKVECSNAYSETNFPYAKRFDWNNDGGIIRDVWLHVSGEHSLRYVHVTPEVNLADSTATARFDIKCWEKAPARAVFSVRVVKHSTGDVIYQGEWSLRPSADGVFSTRTDCGRVELWHFDNPALYRFEVQLLDKKKQVSDAMEDRFGFRSVRTEGDRLLLNGEPVRLPGIENMPGSNPGLGMAETYEYMQKTVQRMKDLNSTITRFHWPQDEKRMALLDSCGMLVQEELPWWQAPGRLTPGLRASARRQIEECIEAHYNHPSIFAWGISNEVGDNRADLPELAALVRSLDSSRIVDVVSNSIYSARENDPSLTLDLPTWNEYMGTWHGNSREDFPASIPAVKKALDGRPILITEHGLCEPAFAGGDARRVDEMIWHISQWKQHPFICGYIYFSLEDYRTHMGEEGVGRDKVRRHGVCDKFLEPKASYYILQQLMSPVLVTRVSQASGETGTATAAAVTLQASSDIPSYTLRGYRLVYEDQYGITRTVDIPVLAPGATFSVTLPDMNRSFKFNVTRADGSVVLKY